MSLWVLETVLRDKFENRAGNPFIPNKNHSYTSQTLVVKRLLAGVCRKLVLFWDFLPETVRCLMTLVEFYDSKSDNYESVMLEVVDRLLLKSDELQKYANDLYSKLMKCFDQQKEKVDSSVRT